MSEEVKDSNKIACSCLRTAANSNLQLYTQADKKAQILIQVNSLMITVLLGTAVRLSEFHRLAIVPVVGQLLFSLTVIFLSLRSTRPARTMGKHETVDLLYFGDYERMNTDDYFNGMKELLGDADVLFPSLMRDVYFQSKVLARKYRYLNIAYLVFIIGLGVNVLAAGAIAI